MWDAANADVLGFEGGFNFGDRTFLRIDSEVNCGGLIEPLAELFGFGFA